MKHVGITTSASSEDPTPVYSFFVYDDSDDPICINMEACAQDHYACQRRKRKVLSPQMMDMMSDEEIEEWYEHNGRSNDDY